MLSFKITRWTWVLTAERQATVYSVDANGYVTTIEATPLLHLPAAERRRLNPLTALALRAAESLVRDMPLLELAQAPMVLGSCDGDGDVLAALLRAIGERAPISPTHFHNSVHNAATGYWSIGLASQAACTAIAPIANVLENTLIEAALQLSQQPQNRQQPVIAVAVDRAFPAALQALLPSDASFAMAAWCEPLGRSNSSLGWCCELQASTAAPAAASLLQRFTRAAAGGQRLELEGDYPVPCAGVALTIKRAV